MEDQRMLMKQNKRLAIIAQHLAPTFSSHRQLDAPLSAQETCGIVAFIGKEQAWDFLIDGLTILENRGYDSAGIATIDGHNQLVCTKFASAHQNSDAISRLKKHKSTHAGHRVGVAHTRWATHGGKTDKNAHPHHDHKDRLALVHNGVITNSDDLKKKLQAKGIEFKSETDTEVIVQLLGAELDEGLEMVEAIKKVQSQLEGTWGCVGLQKQT